MSDGLGNSEADLERGDNEYMRAKEGGMIAPANKGMKCPAHSRRKCTSKQVGTTPWYDCEYCGRSMDD